MPRLRAELSGPRRRLAVVAVLAVAAGLIAYFATSSVGSSSAKTTTASVSPIGPAALTEPKLRTLASSLGQPVYWFGPQPNRRYELQRATNGNVYLRYLPPGAAAGDERPFTLVGTYPFVGAYTAEKGLAKQKGWASRKLAGGWIAVYRKARPTNLYLARSGLEYQVEVFDPLPAQARRIIVAGRLSKIG